MSSEPELVGISRLLDLAAQAIAQGDWQQVEALSKRALELDPVDPDASTFARLAASQRSLARGGARPPRADPTQIADRYELTELLGEGTRKRVYRAWDRLLERPVAIALIGGGPAVRQRVEREARTMARVSQHQHIVTIYDMGESDGRFYLIQEFMGGGDLSSRIGASPGRRIGTADMVAIATQVAAGLAAVHDAGLVHRDLKPSNVFFSSEGEARLGDFGLSLEAADRQVGYDGSMVGTPYYMPPEQALGGRSGPGSDLYSLGAMMYEAIAGRPPFDGASPTSVISQHLTATPVGPSWHSDACPPELEDLVLQMLEKDPARRPASAVEVVNRLARIDPTQRSRRHSEDPVLSLAAGVVVGRERELTTLRTLIDQATEGRGAVALLRGESGAGKSHTVQALEPYARPRGVATIWGRASEGAGRPPFWPWMRAVDQLKASPELAERADLTADPFARIRSATNDAATWQRPLNAGAEIETFRGVMELLRKAAAVHPLVLTIDDLQWADEASLRLFRYVAEEIAQLPLLLLGLLRDEVDAGPELDDLLLTLAKASRAIELRLAPLDAPAIAEYIESTTGREATPDLTRQLIEATGGNPYFVAETVRLMAQEGGKTATSLPEFTLPEGVASVLRRRLNRLSAASRDLLELAAVVGEEFDLTLLPVERERAVDVRAALVDEALAAGILSERDGGYAFAHSAMRDAILGGVSAGRRAVLHGMIGDRLVEVGSDERSSEIAFHLATSAELNERHREPAYRFARLAGERAAQAGAWTEAARLYAGCARMLRLGWADEDEHALAEILLAEGTCERNAANAEFAPPALLEAASHFHRLGDRVSHARAVAAAAFPWYRLPRAQRIELTTEALSNLEGEPYLEALLLMLRAAEDWDAQAEAAAEEAKAIASEHGYDDVLAQLALRDGTRAFAEMRLDDAYAAQWDAHQRLLRGDDMVGAAHAIANVAVIPALRGDLDEAETDCARILAFFESAHQETLATVSTRCFIALARGDLAALRERLAGTRDDAFQPALALAARDEVYGNAAAAAARLRPLLADVGEHSTAWACGSLARVLLAAGQRAAAAEAMETWEATLPNAVSIYRVSALSEPGEALVEFLTPERRREVLAELRTLDSLRHGPSQSLDWLRGELARSVGELEEAEREYQRGLTWAEAARCPVAAARCLHGLAQLLAGRGEIEQASRSLDRAGGLCRSLGATRELERIVAAKLGLQRLDDSDASTSLDVLSTTVAAERPRMGEPAPDGTVTLLFSDIEDSTPLNVRYGDRAWMQLLREHNRIIRAAIKQHGGFEVKTEGDAFMVAFQSARSAVRCAGEMQRELRAWSRTEDAPVRVRIGIHTGEPVAEDADFYGAQVVMASRIAGQAAGGEVLVSPIVRELLEPGGEFAFRARPPVQLKGLAGAHVLHSLVSGPDEDGGTDDD